MQVRCVLNNPSCPYFPCGVVTLLQLPRTQNRRSAGPCRLSGTSTRNVLRKGAWLLPRSARPWLSRGSGSAAAVATMSSNAFRERWTCSVQSHNQNSCYTSSCWLCVLSARHQESRFNLIRAFFEWLEHEILEISDFGKCPGPIFQKIVKTRV